MYQAIKAGLQLSTLNLHSNLGWLEIRGMISKQNFQKGHLSDRLPDKTQLSSLNYIKAPIQLVQEPNQIFDILEQVKDSVV